MSNKGYNNYNKEEKSFEVSDAIQEDALIEASPVANEVKEDIKENPKMRQETKSNPQVKSAPKSQGKITAILRDSCLVENLANQGDIRQLFGKNFLNKKVGDIVEF